MILKLIICQVPLEHRQAFSRGQECWAALGDLEGFAGQTGGWTRADSSEAVIVGLWRDESSYDHFMSDVHDSIFESGGQKGTYALSEIALWDRLFDIRGAYADVGAAFTAAGLIRIARCNVFPDRCEHFVDVQQSVWNPGMADAGGMLAGLFCRSRRDVRQFLVCTLWQSEDEHRRYIERVLPGLRLRAEVQRDCDSVTGWMVPIERSWTVSPGGHDPHEPANTVV